MTLSLIQYRNDEGGRGVAVIGDDDVARMVIGADSTYALAMAAFTDCIGLSDCITRMGLGDSVDLEMAYTQGRLLPPIDHADPAHLLMTGTGLTHLGSAEGRDKMHRAASADPAPTDSMKMFLMGVDGGKPVPGEHGVQPEWFYKGDRSALIAPGAPLPSPAFALDAGEEPEIAGIYIIGPDGTPFRLGFALANEFSDHVTERANYLFLAHSKLRPASVGPEILMGELPQDVRGTSRIVRDGATLWEKPFLTGETNMSHSIANLEHHHFKYDIFRHPGDVHIHFFGTATLSFADGVQTQIGDEFHISAPPFRLPLHNPVGTSFFDEINICML
jgi:hypothetical protein